MTVTSVTGTYEPYNPFLGNQGIPAEQVDFTVNGYPSGDGNLICLIEVFDGSDGLVGSTVAQVATDAGSDESLTESVPVDVTGDVFDGPPSDAVVKCGTDGSTGPVHLDSG